MAEPLLPLATPARAAPVRVEAATAPARRPLVVGVVLLCLFLAAMDATVVGTLLPYMTAQDPGSSLYPWLMSGFIVAGIVVTPVSGQLADAWGGRRALQVALVLFMLGSAAVWAAPTVPGLVAARVLQGLGAGMVTVLAYVLIGQLYTGNQRGRMQALLSLVWGLAAVVGPLAGAALHELAGWRLAFGLNVPLGFLALGLLAVGLPAGPAGGPSRTGAAGGAAGLDLPSQAAFALVLVSLLALLMAPAHGLGAGGLAAALAGLIGGGTGLWARVRQRPQASPLPLSLLRQRAGWAPLACTVGAAAILYAVVTLLPLYLHQSAGLNAVRGGLVVMAAALGWVVGSAVCGQRLGRWGHRTPVVMGAAALALGTAALAVAPPSWPLWGWAAAQLSVGLGMGFVATSTLLLAQNQAPAGALGSHTAAMQLGRQLGAAVGIHLLAALQMGLGPVALVLWPAVGMAGAAPTAEAAGFRVSLAVLAGLALLLGALGRHVPPQAHHPQA
ncbi:MFS transporter [Ideonella livida]|uniref:MFS-type drug efflux transporter P55 n=1 Tax=Ideonella livida TaxID=2707176 RepID=A0A7C9TKK5_9BURK|nr:MFS transporter [Ideonella livida]NDY91824.1 MFS transporter [Ideonella livida]